MSAERDRQVGVERAFPCKDPLARNDAGAERATRPIKPCLHRINHPGLSRFETAVTWCTRDSDHEGPCVGPPPSILELDDLGPKASRRRRW